MNVEIASLEEIGQRLRAAAEKKGVVPRDVMAGIEGHPSLTNWYRWLNGEQEGGCRTIAQIGLFLGLPPDALLLKNVGDELTMEDRVALDQVETLVGELNQIFTGEHRPADYLVKTLQELLQMARARASKPHLDITVDHPAKTVAMQIRKAGRKNAGVGEDPADYGKKKKK